MSQAERVETVDELEAAAYALAKGWGAERVTGILRDLEEFARIARAGKRSGTITIVVKINRGGASGHEIEQILAGQDRKISG